MSLFQKTVYLISKYINWISCIAIAAMVLTVCSNIISRFFGKPFLGAFEIVRMLAALSAAFAVAYTQSVKGHSAVTIIEDRLSKRGKIILNSIRDLILVGLSGIMTWQCALYAVDLCKKGEVTPTLYYPVYPFIIGVTFCCAVLTLVCLATFFDTVFSIVKK